MSDSMSFTELRFPEDGSVIDGLSLTVGRDERTVLYGPNGGGKTTILRLIAGTIGEHQSNVDVSYLPQSPHMFRGTAHANLLLGLVGEERSVALELADILAVRDVLDGDARALSGGQAQRLSIARTLASRAPIVLLDEPLAPITAADRNDVARLIRGRTEDRALICVTHSIETVIALGDRLVIVDDGRVLQDGSPAEVLNDPRTDRVASIVGVGNVVGGTVIGTRDGMATVDCGNFELVVVVDADHGDPVRVRFGAEAVALYRHEPTGGSQRNVISGTVETVIERGRLLEVVLNAGTSVVALVTPGALDALELAVGDRAWFAVKTASLSATRIGT